MFRRLLHCQQHHVDLLFSGKLETFLQSPNPWRTRTNVSMRMYTDNLYMVFMFDVFVCLCKDAGKKGI